VGIEDPGGNFQFLKVINIDFVLILHLGPPHSNIR
jgi:hypothetical protein